MNVAAERPATVMTKAAKNVVQSQNPDVKSKQCFHDTPFVGRDVTIVP